MKTGMYNHNQLKKNLLYIMDEIHRICVKNDIKYSLFYGSLIGAVVHKGFIPWDDDIDIAMSKTDFKKFKEVCKTQLRKDFFLQSRETEKNYEVPGQIKIRLNNTILLEEIDSHLDIHHGVSVDLVCYEDIDDSFSNLKKTKHYFSLFRDKYYYHMAKKHLSLKGYVYHTFRRLFPPFTIKRTADKYIKWSTKYNNPSSKYVFMPFSYQDDIYERSWFNDVKLYKFENREYYGFTHYDQILKVRYPNYSIIPDGKDQKTNHTYVSIKLIRF